MLYEVRKTVAEVESLASKTFAPIFKKFESKIQTDEGLGQWHVILKGELSDKYRDIKENHDAYYDKYADRNPYEKARVYFEMRNHKDIDGMIESVFEAIFGYKEKAQDIISYHLDKDSYGAILRFEKPDADGLFYAFVGLTTTYEYKDGKTVTVLISAFRQ